MPDLAVEPVASRRAEWRLPGPRDRLTILGRTGSGKTHYAAWVLSHSNWPRVPWFVIDYKRDELLDELPAEDLRVDASRLPKAPGLYRVRPTPLDEAAVEQLLWKIWRKERAGLYVDEGHMLPDRGGLQAILSQGRSKHIPAIVLSQRPVWLNRFALSEADYYSVFHLNDKRDRQTVASFLPFDLEASLPRHHSWYYDVARDRSYQMLPVPDRNDILDRFERRNPNHTRWRRI